MDEGMPYPSYFPPPAFDRVSEANGSTTPSVTTFTLCTHMGTHVDAPAHFIPGGKTLQDYSVDRFISSAVVWSIPSASDQPIDVKDLQAAHPHASPGEAVLLSTGWESKWGTNEYRRHPYLSEDAAAWLIDHGVATVGMDLMTPDAPVASRPEGFSFPVHHRLLGAEVLIIENMTGLRALRGLRIELHAVPLRICAEDGAPVRAVGRLSP
jgi:arylformamidase